MGGVIINLQYESVVFSNINIKINRFIKRKMTEAKLV